MTYPDPIPAPPRISPGLRATGTLQQLSYHDHVLVAREQKTPSHWQCLFTLLKGQISFFRGPWNVLYTGQILNSHKTGHKNTDQKGHKLADIELIPLEHIYLILKEDPHVELVNYST